MLPASVFWLGRVWCTLPAISVKVKEPCIDSRGLYIQSSHRAVSSSSSSSLSPGQNKSLPQPSPLSCLSIPGYPNKTSYLISPSYSSLFALPSITMPGLPFHYS